LTLSERCGHLLLARGGSLLDEQLREIVVTQEIRHRPFLFHARGGRRLMVEGWRALLLRQILLRAMHRVRRRGCRGEKGVIGATESLSRMRLRLLSQPQVSAEFAEFTRSASEASGSQPPFS
jgi:hypothetical protein